MDFLHRTAAGDGKVLSSWDLSTNGGIGDQSFAERDRARPPDPGTVCGVALDVAGGRSRGGIPLGRFVGAALPAELAKTIHRRTEGNPLFIVNMTDYLSRQGVVVEEAGQWIVKGERFVAIEEGVPDSLRQLIERQVERLSEANNACLK